MIVRKRFGQHFLEPAWVEKLMRALEPTADQTFLEIGPGRGALTRPLLSRAARVIAFEIDRDLAAGLRVTAPPALTIVEGDFLDLAAERLREILAEGASSVVRVAGNLPYNVASPILFKLVELYAADVPLRDATVMVQREVADRLLSPPGTRESGVLSVMIRQSADVERVFNLPPGAFRPAPKVRSAVVRLRFHRPDPKPISQTAFAALVQTIFTRRRKTLANALLALEKRGQIPFSVPKRGQAPFSEALRMAGIDGRRRPETLDIPELVRLSDAIVRLPAEGRAVLG